MATDIANTADFTTSNIKPANGETIDAVYGQNVADNTGYLLSKKKDYIRFNYTGSEYINYDPQSGNTYGSAIMSFSEYFYRPKNHDQIKIDFIGSTELRMGGAGSGTFILVYQVKGGVGTYTGTLQENKETQGSDFYIGIGSNYSTNVPLSSYVNEDDDALLEISAYFYGTDTSDKAFYIHSDRSKSHTYWS